MSHLRFTDWIDRELLPEDGSSRGKEQRFCLGGCGVCNLIKNDTANDALIAIKSNIFIYWLRRWSVQTGIPTLESHCH